MERNSQIILCIRVTMYRYNRTIVVFVGTCISRTNTNYRRSPLNQMSNRVGVPFFPFLLRLRRTERSQRSRMESRRGERNEQTRWTGRAERRQPSERLAAPPRESRDVTGPPLFFAIPRWVPRARKVSVPPRGPFSPFAMPFFAKCHRKATKEPFRYRAHDQFQRFRR